jgi:type IV fimbrial biogenesis protein FimT
MIELIMVLLIAAILAAVAAPSFASFLNTTRFSSASMQLVSDLNLARSEAIKRNNRVLICLRSGTACGTGTDWRVGWVVCVDANNDNACDAPASASADPTVVAVRPALAANLTLAGSANLVRFNPNGSQGTGTAATLTLGGSWSGASTRVISVSGAGNVTSQ